MPEMLLFQVSGVYMSASDWWSVTFWVIL